MTTSRALSVLCEQPQIRARLHEAFAEMRAAELESLSRQLDERLVRILQGRVGLLTDLVAATALPDSKRTPKP
jgi:hypothetical protein